MAVTLLRHLHTDVLGANHQHRPWEASAWRGNPRWDEEEEDDTAEEDSNEKVRVFP
jgi:hypothetical protein